MLKDLIFKSKRLLDREEDKLPLFMRGELEVIVRNDKDEIVSYQKGNNVVSDFMKHEIIHLLAGDLFSNEVIKTSGSSDVYSGLQYTAGFHNGTSNKDGMLFSNRPFFYSTDKLSHKFVEPDQNLITGITDAYTSPRYPVKMLFGTGVEFSALDWNALLSHYGDASVVEQVLGYTDSGAFVVNIDNDTNYYSNTMPSGTIVKTRTVQDKNTSPITESLSPNTIFGITGAIKNGLIETNADLGSKYDIETQSVNLPYRGIGRPSFIYASRSLASVKQSSLDQNPGYVKIGQSEGVSSFENKLIFSVVMPRTTEYYPYNGWILKEAGLFSDSLLTIGGVENENTNKMPCGNLLAKRYISPILKSFDNSVEFIWSIYITP